MLNAINKTDTQNKNGYHKLCKLNFFFIKPLPNVNFRQSSCQDRLKNH